MSKVIEVSPATEQTYHQKAKCTATWSVINDTSTVILISALPIFSGVGHRTENSWTTLVREGHSGQESAHELLPWYFLPVTPSHSLPDFPDFYSLGTEGRVLGP